MRQEREREREREGERERVIIFAQMLASKGERAVSPWRERYIAEGAEGQGQKHANAPSGPAPPRHTLKCLYSSS